MEEIKPLEKNLDSLNSLISSVNRFKSGTEISKGSFSVELDHQTTTKVLEVAREALQEKINVLNREFAELQ